MVGLVDFDSKLSGLKERERERERERETAHAPLVTRVAAHHLRVVVIVAVKHIAQRAEVASVSQYATLLTQRVVMRPLAPRHVSRCLMHCRNDDFLCEASSA